jgi:hypothetical protein
MHCVLPDWEQAMHYNSEGQIVAASCNSNFVSIWAVDIDDDIAPQRQQHQQHKQHSKSSMHADTSRLQQVSRLAIELRQVSIYMRSSIYAQASSVHYEATIRVLQLAIAMLFCVTARLGIVRTEVLTAYRLEIIH